MIRSKRDANEAGILAALSALGVWYRQMDRENGFDLLLCWRSRSWIVEIKNGALPPSARKLSQNELRTRSELEAIGVEYHVCETLNDVLRVIGAID